MGFCSSTFLHMTKSLTCAKTGQSLQLTERIALSGEGSIWQTDRPNYLAKLYTQPTYQRIQKLEVMVANPPREPNAHLGHTSFGKCLFSWTTSGPNLNS